MQPGDVFMMKIDNFDTKYQEIRQKIILETIKY